MDRQEFLRKFEALLEVPPESLTEDMALDRVESWDSLNVIGYIALVDETLHREIDPEKIQDCKTVGKLLDLALG